MLLIRLTTDVTIFCVVRRCGVLKYAFLSTDILKLLTMVISLNHQSSVMEMFNQIVPIESSLFLFVCRFIWPAYLVALVVIMLKQSIEGCEQEKLAVFLLCLYVCLSELVLRSFY